MPQLSVKSSFVFTPTKYEQTFLGQLVVVLSHIFEHEFEGPNMDFGFMEVRWYDRQLTILQMKTDCLYAVEWRWTCVKDLIKFYLAILWVKLYCFWGVLVSQTSIFQSKMCKRSVGIINCICGVQVNCACVPCHCLGKILICIVKCGSQLYPSQIGIRFETMHIQASGKEILQSLGICHHNSHLLSNCCRSKLPRWKIVKHTLWFCHMVQASEIFFTLLSFDCVGETFPLLNMPFKLRVCDASHMPFS